MATIKGFRINVEAKATIYVTDVPTIPADYLGFDILPDTVNLVFRLPENQDAWVCAVVKVHGNRVLKPGIDGNQRIGKTSHTAEWFAHAGRDVTATALHNYLPDWLRALIEQARPEGCPSTPNL